MLTAEVELENGKRYWFAPNLYGSMAKDFFEASQDMDSKFVYLGTAGATNSSLKVGDKVTPRKFTDSLGTTQNAPWVQSLPGVTRSSVHQSVPTFLIETKAWLENKQKEGVGTVDVEFDHARLAFESAGPNRFYAALVTSDVLDGPNHRDISQWSYSDGKSLVPFFQSAFQSIAGKTSKVKAVRWFPMVGD